MIHKLKNILNEDIHLKEILSGSAITFVLKMSGMLLGYVVILIISRKYGAEGVGVYNLTLSLMTFVAMIASMGMNVSILRYVGQFNKSGEEHKLKLLYRYAVELVVPFSLLLAVLLYFFADVIAIKLFNNPIYKSALEFAAIIVPFMALQNISVEFIRGLKQLKVSEFLRSVSRSLINIILLLIMSIFLVDQLIPLYTLGIGVAVSAIFAVYVIRKKIKNIKTKEYQDFSKRELISTSLPMMLTTISLFIIGNISLYMLEIFSTTEEVGVFSVSLKIATLISLVLIVINTMSAPKFSELYWSQQYEELQSVISKSTKLIFITSLIIAFFLIVFSNFLLSLFGDEFITGNSILVILVAGQLVNAMAGSVGVLLNMTGHQIALRNILVVSVFASIVLNYILIRNYGMNGAAIASVVSVTLWNISAIIFIKYKLNIITFYIPWKINKGY